MDTKFFISLGVGLFIQAAGIVWWLAGLQASMQHNNFQIQMINKDVQKNSNFVELWPAGKIGTLEIQVDKLNTKIYNGGNRK